MTSSQSAGFDAIFENFRALGGIADNIRAGFGARGRGLFAIDASRPIAIRVPRALLFPTDEIELADGALRLSRRSNAGAKERRFFEGYEHGLSWVDGGRAEVMDFLQLLSGLPAPARSCLVDDFGLGYLFQPHGESAILERFVRARHFNFHGKAVLMPILELANHSWRGGAYEPAAESLGASGAFEGGEIVLRYSEADSWQRFVQYGFVSEERSAYCLPMEIRLPSGRLAVGHEPAVGQARNGYLYPLVRNSAGRIELSHLLLGDREAPHAPRSLFISLMQNAGVAQPAVLFDRICHINRAAFLKLLAAVEDHDGRPAAAIRRLARLQLEALSFVVGAREL